LGGLNSAVIKSEEAARKMAAGMISIVEPGYDW
jgi:hypothetical protein